MRARFAVLILMTLAVVLVHVSSAAAFREYAGAPWGAWLPVENLDCEACHRDDFMTKDKGPHGGYTDTTDECGVCHYVHEAILTNKLLPATTILEICNSCHDLDFTGTGGSGVYGAIRARGQVVQSRHDIWGYNNTETAPGDGSKSYEATSWVPGGMTSLDDTLTCTSCHTPHGNTIIPAFKGERIRFSIVSNPPGSSNRILQDDVNGTPKETYTVYGADWCAACHDRRHAGSKGLAGVNNHPVDQGNTAYAATSAAAQGVAWTATATADGTLPARQAGWSREATPGWAPLCQQCHEDYRDVESAFIIKGYGDGLAAGQNPPFQNFPHESQARSFQVETGDDLCLNCHVTAGLP